MSKIIIIGLGTTGLSIVNYIQKFYYEFTGKDKPDNVEYLFIETAVKEEATKTPIQKESSIKKVPIPLSRSGDFIRNYRNKPSWFPDDITADALGDDGAEGVSRFGRLALWKNWATVRNAIEIAHRGGSIEDRVYIVGSFMGGTCTGTFLDMAYLAQKVTGSDRIYGFFLIPPADDDDKKTVHQSYLNAISTMRYYQKTSANMHKKLYSTDWVDEKDVSFPTKPFKHVYLFSREYKDYAKTNNSNIKQTIGMHICSRLMNNSKLEDEVFTKSIDIIDKEDFNYSSLGTTLISYPLSQLQQIVGLEKCESIIKKLNDEVNFYDKPRRNYEKIELKIKEIVNKYQKEFEEILLSSMNCQDEKKLFPKIQTEISRLIAENKISELPILFSINNDHNFYADVCDCKNSIKMSLVDKIFNMGVDIMNEYKNINILLKVIESIQEFIGSCDKKNQGLLGFWKKQYDLSDDVNTYVRTSGKYIRDVISVENQYKLLGRSKDFLIESSKNALMLCKMHVTIEILLDIKEEVLQGSVIMGEKNALLTINEIKDIKSILSHLVDNTNVKNNIPKRISEIKANIKPNDDNFHFKYLFYNNLDEDIEEIKSNTKKEPEIYKGDILPYLIEIRKSKKAIKLFADCLAAVNSMFEGEESSKKTINEIVERMRNNPEEFGKVKHFFDSPMDYESVIRKKVPALLKLHGTDFESEANLQLVYSMANFSTRINIAGESSYLEGIGDPETDANIKNGVILQDLKNLAILIFQQYSQKDNKKWIDIVEDIDINYGICEKIKVEDLSKDNPYLTKVQIEEVLEPLKHKK